MSESLLISRLRAVLPPPVKRPLGFAWSRGLDALQYLRGKNILRRYAAHHRQARRVFGRDGHHGEIAVGSIRDVGVRLVRPEALDNLIALQDGYEALVARVSRSAATLFERSANCRLFPHLPAGPVPDRTAEVPGLKNGEIITIQLVAPLEVEGVRDLCVPIMEELERKVYGSYVLVDKLYIYRSPVSRQVPSASWLWHFDNHPHEVLKVMVYLTDVTDGTAPFEYLRRVGSSKPLYGSPIAPFYGHSRIAESEVRRLLSDGHESYRVTGPRGTLIVFDENVVHRGTLALERHRDVLVFQVRPATFAARPYISDRWTGSFQHRDINRDPHDIRPHLKG